MGNFLPRFVVMGVSGVGKTTIAVALADRLGTVFLDADDYHPEISIEKMRSGIPLTEEDRLPWLRESGRILAKNKPGSVLSCSALAQRYRDLLRAMVPDVWFIFLSADQDQIARRLAKRKNHFMPPSLLASQFAELEPLEVSEPGITVDATLKVSEIVDICVSNYR